MFWYKVSKQNVNLICFSKVTKFPVNYTNATKFSFPNFWVGGIVYGVMPGEGVITKLMRIELNNRE